MAKRFCVGANYLHLLWCSKMRGKIQQMFLKYTAPQIKFNLVDSGNDEEFEKYISTQCDREYYFWERRAYEATMYTRKVAEQKLDHMHYNPVKAGLCEFGVDYKYSSARYYELNED